MIEIDQAYKDLFNEYGGKSLKLTFFKEEYHALYPSETLYPSEDLYPSEMSADAVDFSIEDDQIVTDSLAITESLCSDEDLSFGSCEAAQFEITVTGLTQSISGREFMATESFGGYNMVLGLFKVESTPKQEDKNTRKIIAYDRMQRFDVDVSGWYNALSFPMTLKAFRKSLCSFVGVREENAVLVNDEMQVEKTINPTALKGREVLQQICQINGVFGNINKNGELRYIALPEKEDISARITIYQNAESEEYTVPDIDTVQIRQEEGDIGGTSTGDGQNVYIIEGNMLVYGKTTSEMIGIANNIKNVVNGLEYQPATISTNGSPWIEIGDRISLETTDGIVNTLVMKRTFTGIQGAMDSYESTGSQELSRPFSIESELIQIKGLSAILKRSVEEISNELTNLEEGTNSKFTQMANQISLEVTRATGQEAELRSAINVVSDKIELKVSQGDVSNQLSVETGGISIKGNRFSWSSTYSSMTADGKLIASSGSFTGDVVANSFKTNDGSITLANGKLKITGAEIDGTANTSSIGASTIYTNHLEVGGNAVFNSGADFSGAINCQNIDANRISCVSVYSSMAGETWSDIRLKHDIRDVHEKLAVEVIKGLRPVAYALNVNDAESLGFIAQEVKKMCADLGTEIPLYTKNGKYYSIPYINYIPVIVKALQFILRKVEVDHG